MAGITDITEAMTQILFEIISTQSNDSGGCAAFVSDAKLSTHFNAVSDRVLVKVFCLHSSS